jgi:two-component system NtrC family sensor kinase
VLLDRDGRVLTANQALATLLGSQIEELIGESWLALCQRTDPPICAPSALDLCAGGYTHQQRMRVSLPSGQLRIVDVEMFPVAGAADPIDQLVVHLADVTDHLQLEEQERFAASGRLAATVAHEVNTPLQAIESCLHLAGRVGDEQRGQYLRLARDELHRVSHILRQLLDLYRPSMSADAPVDLNALIERVLLLTSSSLARQGIDVQCELMSQPPTLYGRADGLTQMLLNLIFNALQAMPHGGTLALRTRAMQTEPDQPADPSSAATMQLVLEIEDSGVGMTPEVQERIFDPFFTTKADGSGLGLAITQKIVSEHQGRILVRSTPNIGTIFTISFMVAR